MNRPTPRAQQLKWKIYRHLNSHHYQAIYLVSHVEFYKIKPCYALGMVCLDKPFVVALPLSPTRQQTVIVGGQLRKACQDRLYLALSDV